MNESILDFFTIGIGPSSSHTVGPMRAAADFVHRVGKLDGLTRLRCDLYGSLAATGKGHGTDTAILLGWMGLKPSTVEIDSIPGRIEEIRHTGRIALPGGKEIACSPRDDLNFLRLEPLPRHPNGMHFLALGDGDKILLEDVVYSLGGGFIRRDADWDEFAATEVMTPYPFSTAASLLEICRTEERSISDIALANESVFRSEPDTREQFDRIWLAMKECVERGCRTEGTLPGGLKVKRRAPDFFRNLQDGSRSAEDPLVALDWVNLFALSVNEENAAGGRVVTAPTNGAAGIIPAVLHYACRFRKSPHQDAVHRFLLVAGAIASLYKENASLSGADVGCQGEVGVACSMAAGALVEYLGGTPEQAECAAEIGMEHNLGLTCDPVGGLVQVPCIERNAMGSVKAINATRLAMSGDGTHIVSLDKVIATMRDTGRDMMSKYKETSRGGLAVNVTEC